MITPAQLSLLPVGPQFERAATPPIDWLPVFCRIILWLLGVRIVPQGQES